MANWNLLEVQEWKTQAKKEQQFFCDALGDRDYDAFTSDQVKYLDLKIGNAFFGPPKIADENQNEIEVSNYETDQQKHIEKLREVILSKTGRDNVRVAFIFLIVKEFEKQHYQVPVIRVLDANDEDVFFVDHVGRLYKGWDHFLVENIIPKSYYCYPSNGQYELDEKDHVNVTFDTSPSCNLSAKVAQYADTTSLVTTLASTGMLVGGLLISPAAPFLMPAAAWAGLTSGFYTVGRNAYKLYDRGGHSQSVNPFTDPEARECWFACLGGACGMGSMGLRNYMTALTRNGDVACKALRVTYSCLEGGNLTVNGLGIVSQVYDLCDRKEPVSVKDVAHLSASILFFTHSCVSLKSASTIIKEVQTSVLAEAKASLPVGQRGKFKKLCRKSVGRDRMHGNARVIKSLKHVDNLENFMKNTSTIQKNAGKGHNVKLADKGLISINGQLNIHPDKMVTIDSESRKKILNSTKKLQKNPNYAQQFSVDMTDICKQERIQFEITRKATVENMRRSFGVNDLSDFKLKGTKIFKDLQPHEIDRLGNVMEHSGLNYDKEFLDIVTEFASKNHCKSSSDFCSLVEFAHKFVLNEQSDLMHLPKKTRQAEVLARLKNPGSEAMDNMQRKFTELKTEISGMNSTCTPQFTTDNLATYHFYKHCDFGEKELTAADYFQMLKDHFSNGDLPKSSTLSQEGDAVFITITDPSIGARGVMIKPLVEANDSTVFTATFMYDKRVHNTLSS